MQRTERQNRALHLYCKHLAESLNEAGLDMRTVLKPEIEIPWTMISVKDHLWRPIQEAIIERKSTTELETKDIDLIFNTLNRHLSEKFGLFVDFPSIETIMSEMRTKGK